VPAQHRFRLYNEERGLPAAEPAPQPNVEGLSFEERLGLVVLSVTDVPQLIAVNWSEMRHQIKHSGLVGHILFCLSGKETMEDRQEPVAGKP
jgi:hypothetical protein